RRQLLEPLGDHAQAVFAEVLRLDPQRFREAVDHAVRRDGAVAVHEVVEISGRQTGLRRQAPVGHSRLVHQPLDRRAEGLLAEPSLAWHQTITSCAGTRRSAPVARSRTSTIPSSRVFLPTVTRTGHPIRSASANFSPALRSRSSSRTLEPDASIEAATPSASSSRPGSTTTWTSYGAI